MSKLLRRTLLNLGSGGPPADAELLGRYVAQCDEAAFAEIVRRHGPMVFRVCQRMLRQTPDVEDAFQATFVVLARHAMRIGKRESLGSWLHGVAYRVALQARRQMARDRQRRGCTDPASLPEDRPEPLPADVRELLDRELQRLPERLRAPLVLCYLQGKTNAEAAQVLGYATNTIEKQLIEARAVLRTRLSRGGVALSAAGLTALLNGEARAALPATLAVATTECALLTASGKSVAGAGIEGAGAVCSRVAALADATLAGASSRGWRWVAAILLLGSGLGLAAALASQRPALRSETAASRHATRGLPDVTDIKYLGFIPPPHPLTINAVALPRVHTYSAQLHVDDGRGSIQVVTEYCFFGHLHGDEFSTRPSLEEVRARFWQIAAEASNKNRNPPIMDRSRQSGR